MFAGKVKIALGDLAVKTKPDKLAASSASDPKAIQPWDGEAFVTETFSKLFPDSFQHVMPVLMHKVCCCLPVQVPNVLKLAMSNASV